MPVYRQLEENEGNDGRWAHNVIDYSTFIISRATTTHSYYRADNVFHPTDQPNGHVITTVTYI